jgi:hypothetical protein
MLSRPKTALYWRLMSADGLRRMRESAERVADSAVPVYRYVARGTPELIGSAVLLEICERRFLCTAAHVLDARDGRDVHLPHGRTLQPFGAAVHITQMPASGRREDDKLDFAIVELEGDNFDRFSSYRFITLAEIDQNEVPRAGRTYAFAGYPVSRNKSKRGTAGVREHVVHYTGGPLPQDRYDNEGLNLAPHLIVDFNLKNMVEGQEIVQPIHPRGLSGGTVWRLGDLQEFEDHTNREGLVGIGMEFRDDALIAVRISVILEAIRGFFPDLDACIPRSQWIALGMTVKK